MTENQPALTEKMLDDYCKEIIQVLIPNDELSSLDLTSYLEKLRTTSMDQWTKSLGLDIPENTRLQIVAFLKKHYSRLNDRNGSHHKFVN